MWKIDVAEPSDNEFIMELPDDSFYEITNHFTEIIKTFSKINSSVICTSGIFPVTSYNEKDKKLSIHYHVDNDEKIIRVTSVVLE